MDTICEISKEQERRLQDSNDKKNDNQGNRAKNDRWIRLEEVMEIMSNINGKSM